MNMAVPLKTPEQIALSRKAGHLAAEVLRMIGAYVKPGVTTGELDSLCHDYIVNVQHAIPANVGYKGFPKTVCTSVNHVVCHGIPSAQKTLKKGDIVNIDVAVIKDGWFGDCSRMYFVDEPSPLARRLVETTYEAMRSRAWRTASVSAWYASTAATASGRSTTTIRRCCTTAGPAKA